MSSNKPKTITVKDLKNLKNAEESFNIKERIGAGTYGEVFTALHKDKNKMVAIKAMNLQPDEVHEIVSEVNTLSQYSDHNNIARYFGCYIKRGPVAQIWIAMEYCAGGSIFDLIKHGGNNGKHYFKEDWIAYASREILEGLKYLHYMKVIHRDIKGQNILLTDKAEVKLVDFGVSAKLDKTVGKRCTFIGTPYWMAPEVIECEKDPSKSYTFECDIWSTGITAMEMAEGKPPLNDLHPMTALFKIPSNEPPKLKNPREWSDKFKEFLKLCLKKNYKQRPPAEELLSSSRFVKNVNSERAQVELRQAIERVHRTKGHSRKLQRDLILRPDEGASLEESDEDNPETIKTIREQFKKMDNNKQPYMPQPAQPQVVSSQVSHVAQPFHNRMNNPSNLAQQVKRHDGVDINIRKMYENQNRERKTSSPFLNGNTPGTSGSPALKEELSRKASQENSSGNNSANGAKAPFPISVEVRTSQESKVNDVNKRNSRNFESVLANESSDKSGTHASVVQANIAIRRHQNDPTPELPRKASYQPAPVSSKLDGPRKFSVQDPIGRPGSAGKDLRQHPISRQNAPMTRVTTSPASVSTSTTSVASINDRPLPAQPPKSTTPTTKFSNSVVQRQSVPIDAESSSKAVWSRSRNLGPHAASNESPMPMKLETIEHSPGARRKSYAARSEEMQQQSQSKGIVDNSGGGYSQLRLEGSVTESSTTDPADRAPSRTGQQASFPYVDSESDSTLSRPSTVKKSNISFEDSFTSCFNSSYSNLEEERRKVSSKSQNAEHSPSSSSASFAASQRHVDGSEGRQNVPYREPSKHWQRNSVVSMPINSVANNEYGNSPLSDSTQQSQVKSKGAVTNPDYGTNVAANAFSNDQYGVNAAKPVHHMYNRKTSNDINNSNAVSNVAYDVNMTVAGSDSDYESLVGPSKVQHIYTNQLEAVRETGQYQPEGDASRFDDSGVYSFLDAEARNNEALDKPHHLQPTASENNINLTRPSFNVENHSPQPMPRNMNKSRERLPVSSSQGDVSMVTAKASLVAAPMSITPSHSQENLSGSSEERTVADRNLHCSIGSESSTSLAEESGNGLKEETPIEDDLSDDSDKEQADRFGTILVSSKPKPIQPEVTSKTAQGQHDLQRSGSEKNRKQLNRLSAAECSSSSSLKSNQSANPQLSTPQNKKASAPPTVSPLLDPAIVPQHRKSNSRSKSQERPVSQLSKKSGAIDVDSNSTPQDKTQTRPEDEVNLRRRKDSKSGKSMEDVSNKRASMISMPSSALMDSSRLVSVVTSETPRTAADKMKRQSTAENNSPMNRSRKGSATDHKSQFNSFGFGVNSPSSVNVPINISNSEQGNNSQINPEIRKFLKKFKAEVLCACLWGVNLLIGTTKGLYFMDRSGGCDVKRLVGDRKFTQMEIIPSLSLLVTISGKNNRLREYYLKVLHEKIIKDATKLHDEYADIGNKIEQCNSFKIVKYDAIRFLVVAYRTGIIVLAWAPKPCHKFMAVTEYKDLKGEPLFVNVAIREAESGGKFVLKVVYATNQGFHVVDDSGSQDIFMPSHLTGLTSIRPHCIMTFPKDDEPAFLLCYNSEGAYVTDEGKFFRDAMLQWGEAPITSVAAVGSTHIMGWAANAIEFRSLTTGQLDGVFMQKNTFKMRFLCECNDKVFFSSFSKSGVSQIYLLTLNHQSMIGSK